METEPNILVLFDLDGTITSKDTFIGFFRFAVGSFKFFKSCILNIGCLFKSVSNQTMKEKLLTYHFKNTNYESFDLLGCYYAREFLPKLIKKNVRKKIQWHIKNHHKIVIVSASIKNWIEDWCKKYDFDLIANSLELKHGRITGKFEGIYCHGEGKAILIKQRYNLSDYSMIYAYGNSKSDIPMLELAKKRYYKAL